MDRTRVRKSQAEYLEHVERLAHAVVGEALDEGWLWTDEPVTTASPLQAAIAELANSLRFAHTHDDGCLEYMESEEEPVIEEEWFFFPDGALQALLDVALELGWRANLVRMPHVGAAPLDAALEGDWAALRGFEPRVSCEWPGTTTLGDPATILTGRVTPSLVDWLLAVGPSPFELRGPCWPEDLSLVRPDGSVAFTSISHERVAWSDLTNSERRLLTACLHHRTGSARRAFTLPERAKRAEG